MKKIFGMIAALAMSAACLTACGNAEDEFVGKWECTEMKAEGVTITDDFQGIPIGTMIQMEFKDDKTGTITAMGEESQDFTWTVDGDVVSADIDGEKTEIKKEDDLIVMTEDLEGSDATVKLKKVDEFTEFDPSILDGGESAAE